MVSLRHMPEPQKVQQVVGLHKTVAVQIRASCVTAPPVIDIGHGVVVDRSVIGATREHADASVVTG